MIRLRPVRLRPVRLRLGRLCSGRFRSAVSVLALSATLAGLAVAPARAQLFGPSDEDVARENAQNQGIADLTQRANQADGRLQALEAKVRSLTESLAGATGANEELSHRIQLQNRRIDAMQKDFAYRLCTLTAQQMGVPGDGSDGGLNCAAAGSEGGAGGFAAPRNQGASGPMQPGQPLPPIGTGQGQSGQTLYDDTPGRGRPPGILGTLPAAPGTPLPPPPAMPGGAADGASGGNGSGGADQYNRAMNLLSTGQFTQASAAFQAYADTHPDDTDLTPQAFYWLGNINYLQRNYEPAQRNFAEVLKKYPKSPRAPEAMLKLAQAFLAGGRKSEGCTTLGLIKSKYPKAPDATLDTAASLRRASCR